MAASTVRCRPAQVAAAATMLAHAFEADPMMRYVLPLPVHRQFALPSLMVAGLQVGMQGGEVRLASGTAAAASWLGPGEPAGTPGDDAEALAAVGQALGPDAAARLAEVTGEFARVRAELVPGPHWYLALLGVEPGEQGRGLGSLLVAELLQRAAAASLPVYLETTNEANLAFYRRHGFTVARAGATPGGLAYWAMRHEP